MNIKSVINFIKMQRHHRGWLVRYPASWNDWDFKTMREQYFETGGIGGESAYNQARRFVKKLKEAAHLQVKESGESIDLYAHLGLNKELILGQEQHGKE